MLENASQMGYTLSCNPFLTCDLFPNTLYISFTISGGHQGSLILGVICSKLSLSTSSIMQPILVHIMGSVIFPMLFFSFAVPFEV